MGKQYGIALLKHSVLIAVSGTFGQCKADDCDCVNTGDLVDLFCKHYGHGLTWINKSNPNDPHEAGFLKLDSSKVKEVFGYTPRWHIDQHRRLLYLVSYRYEKQNGSHERWHTNIPHEERD